MNTNPNGSSQAGSDPGQAQMNEAALRGEGMEERRSGNGHGALAQDGRQGIQGGQGSQGSQGARVGQGRQMQAAQNATPVLPAVDIFEDDAGVTIMADLPGVSRERLGVRIDGDNLVIEGSAEAGETGDVASAGDMEMIYGEVLNPFYRRSFTLSRDLDASRIEANLNHGVLKLVIPKAEAAKPRRIDVQVG